MDQRKYCKQEDRRHVCERAIRKAYRRINLGGCTWEIQQAALCQAEWCSPTSILQCNEECATVRSKLDTCVDGIIRSFLESAGIAVEEAASR